MLPSVLFEDEDVERFFQGKLLYSCEYCHVHPLTEALQNVLESRH